MGTEFKFYDYVEKEENLIHAWLQELPRRVKAKFNKWLLHLEGVGPGGWSRPYVDTLTGDCNGLFEIRVQRSRINYRILGCHETGERMPTLLHGFIKADAKVQKADCQTALTRKENVRGDLDWSREVHDYS